MKAIHGRMSDAVDRFASEMRRASEAHHFVWYDIEACTDGPERESYFLRDHQYWKEA